MVRPIHGDIDSVVVRDVDSEKGHRYQGHLAFVEGGWGETDRETETQRETDIHRERGIS